MGEEAKTILRVDQEEVSLLILDYLKKRKLLKSFVSLEKELGLRLQNYSKEVEYFKNLVIGGKLDEAVLFLKPFQNHSNFDFKTAVFTLKRQKVFEMLEARDADKDQIIAELKSMEGICTKDQWNNLCFLISSQKITDQPQFIDWSVQSGRLKAFEQTKTLLQIIYPVKSTRVPETSGPILLNLLSSACSLHYLVEEERIKSEMEDKGGRVSIFSLLKCNAEEALRVRWDHEVKTCFTHQSEDVVSSSVNLDALTSKDFGNISTFDPERAEMSMELGALGPKSPKLRSSSQERKTVSRVTTFTNASSFHSTSNSTQMKKQRKNSGQSDFSRSKVSSKQVSASQTPKVKNKKYKEDSQEEEEKRKSSGKRSDVSQKKSFIEDKKSPLLKKTLPQETTDLMDIPTAVTPVHLPEPFEGVGSISSLNLSFYSVRDIADPLWLFQQRRRQERELNFLEFIAIGTNAKALKLFSLQHIIEKLPEQRDEEPLEMSPLYQQKNHHHGSIYCLDWSPKGRLLATGSNDKLVKILVVPKLDQDVLEVSWINHKESESLELQLKGHQATVRSVCFNSQNEGQLFSGGIVSPEVKVWDTETGKNTVNLGGAHGSISCVKSGPDGHTCVAVGSDKKINIWDVRAPQTPSITSSKLVALAAMNEIAIDPASLKVQALITNQSSLVGDSRNGKFAVAHADGKISLWDLANISGLPVHVYEDIHEEDCRSLSFNQDGIHLASSSFDGTVQIIDIENLQGNSSIVLKHEDRAVCVRWHPFLPLLLSTGADNTARIWIP